MTKVPFAESRRLLIVIGVTVGHQEREEEEERQEVEGEGEQQLNEHCASPWMG